MHVSRNKDLSCVSCKQGRPKCGAIKAEDTPAGTEVTRVEVFHRTMPIVLGFFQSHLRDMMSTELRCCEDFVPAGKHRQQIDSLLF